jgi:aldose 1-epimerase
MSLQTKPFGWLPDNSEVTLFTLTNENGLAASVMNYGATLVQLLTPDRDGKLADITLGFNTLDGYIKHNSPYFGCIVGRCCNRIAHGRFHLNGHEHRLATNNGPHHLHGGSKGFDKAFWLAETGDAESSSVKFTYRSPDGEEGYPGNLNVAVVYALTDNNELIVEYTATTDKATPVNLTNHTYFNLTGVGTILDHEMMIDSSQFVPVDETLIPTGKLQPVKGTPMDFTKPTRIGQRLDQVGGDPIGYDHCYAVNNADGKIRFAARASDPKSGRVLEVHTTQPGVQFYTGNFLNGRGSGKSGMGYQQHAGFCLETQHFPDAINQPTFPSIVLHPGETYSQKTTFRFTVTSIQN